MYHGVSIIIQDDVILYHEVSVFCTDRVWKYPYATPLSKSCIVQLSEVRETPYQATRPR